MSFIKRAVDAGTNALATPTGLKVVRAGGKKISGFLPFEGIRRSIGSLTSGAVGRTIGGLVGKGVGALTGNPEKGKQIGSAFGESTLGFKNGGRVKRNGKYLVHKSEYILPKGVKATKKQMKIIKRRKAKK